MFIVQQSMYMTYLFIYNIFFFCINRRPPKSTRTDQLFPDPTPFPSIVQALRSQRRDLRRAETAGGRRALARRAQRHQEGDREQADRMGEGVCHGVSPLVIVNGWPRSEEHTSELQSLMRISYAVFCLKKKK